MDDSFHAIIYYIIMCVRACEREREMVLFNYMLYILRIRGEIERDDPVLLFL